MRDILQSLFLHSQKYNLNSFVSYYKTMIKIKIKTLNPQKKLWPLSIE